MVHVPNSDIEKLELEHGRVAKSHPMFTRNVKRSIRRSTQAASIGVLYRAGPPVEAVFFSAVLKRSSQVAAGIVRTSVAPFLHQGLDFGVVAVGQDESGGHYQAAGSADPR